MEQLAFDWPFEAQDFVAYLTRTDACEREIARLTEDLAGLKLEYQTRLPIRAIATALKVVKARQKLAEHPKEPLSLDDQARLEQLVGAHLAQLAQETQAAVDGLTAQRAVPDMTRGGA